MTTLPEMPHCETMINGDRSNIVSDLHQVVDLVPRDHGIAIGATVDCRAGADLDIILQDDASDLQHFAVTRGFHDIAEAVLSDAAAGCTTT